MAYVSQAGFEILPQPPKRAGATVPDLVCVLGADIFTKEGVTGKKHSGPSGLDLAHLASDVKILALQPSL